MASALYDQAAGLRRLMGEQAPRRLVVTLTRSQSAHGSRDLLNLQEALLAVGQPVVMADAQATAQAEPEGGLGVTTPMTMVLAAAQTIPAESDELLLVLDDEPSSIQRAYAEIKRMHQLWGRRAVWILVHAKTSKRGDTVAANLAKVCQQHLGQAVRLLAIVALEEALIRAEALGQAVVRQFPRSAASVSYRRAAQRLLETSLGPSPHV